LDIDYISLLVIVVLVIREKILQEAEGLVKVSISEVLKIGPQAINRPRKPHRGGKYTSTATQILQPGLIQAKKLDVLTQTILSQNDSSFDFMPLET